MELWVKWDISNILHNTAYITQYNTEPLDQWQHLEWAQSLLICEFQSGYTHVPILTRKKSFINTNHSNSCPNLAKPTQFFSVYVFLFSRELTTSQSQIIFINGNHSLLKCLWKLFKFSQFWLKLRRMKKIMY